MAFADANEIRLAPMEVILIASEAEREYIGLTNGILDQACIVLGKKDHLLMLDCDTNEYRLIPRAASMPPMKIVIFFSWLTRSLINSNYNLRVHECRTAAWIMQAYDNVPPKTPNKTFLRDVSRDALAKYQDKMPERFVKRATHFYSEYRRVREGITAWEKGDLNWFGRLSFESCESSIHNYECGSPELVAIYNAMRQTDGIYGGRFSGAGFKGACISLCDPDKIEAIEQSVREKYLAEFPQYKDAMECYFCDIADGARIMED
jgi:galactokinase/galacturonokinase